MFWYLYSIQFTIEFQVLEFFPPKHVQFITFLMHSSSAYMLKVLHSNLHFSSWLFLARHFTFVRLSNPFQPFHFSNQHPHTFPGNAFFFLVFMAIQFKFLKGKKDWSVDLWAFRCYLMKPSPLITSIPLNSIVIFLTSPLLNLTSLYGHGDTGMMHQSNGVRCTTELPSDCMKLSGVKFLFLIML